MATEQLYRRCLNCSGKGWTEEVFAIDKPSVQVGVIPCPECSRGYVPVDPPNVPAIVAAARAVVDDIDGRTKRMGISGDAAIAHRDLITALREALASTVAPLTERDKDALWSVARRHIHPADGSNSALGRADFDANAMVSAFIAKLAELRPELAPYLGVGDA